MPSPPSQPLQWQIQLSVQPLASAAVKFDEFQLLLGAFESAIAIHYCK
ncbi:MAG: hypothetical protein KME17_08715 [Cyanosarcina radialis HA8281-LM2]|nr:hypothetical protein [Cyanosarcina radialis HA8281-LM2]